MVDTFEVLCFLTVGKITAEPYPVKSIWQHMLKKKADELLTGNGLCLLFITIGIIRITKCYIIFCNALNTAVADSGAVSVSGEVLHGIPISIEGLFYKWIPLFGIESVNEF